MPVPVPVRRFPLRPVGRQCGARAEVRLLPRGIRLTALSASRNMKHNLRPERQLTATVKDKHSMPPQRQLTDTIKDDVKLGTPLQDQAITWL